MKIEWNKVTRLSQGIAVALFFGIYALGFWTGTQWQLAHLDGKVATRNALGLMETGDKIIADLSYRCDAKKTIRAIFRPSEAEVFLSGGEHLRLPHAMSADGARFANTDESKVFWTKGEGAFMTEGSTTTYANCTSVPYAQPR